MLPIKTFVNSAYPCIACRKVRGGFKFGADLYSSNHSRSIIWILQLPFLMANLVCWLFLVSVVLGITLLLVTRVSLYSSEHLFRRSLSCHIGTWQSLASADITVSVDHGDISAALESEKVTALSTVPGACSAAVVGCVWLQFLHHRRSSVVPVAHSRRKFHTKCQVQRLCIRPCGSHL
jgi:hypothetical protein